MREAGLETKIERIDQVVTTYFEVDTKVWGTEASGKILHISIKKKAVILIRVYFKRILYKPMGGT